jgi:hypothetical protein
VLNKKSGVGCRVLRRIMKRMVLEDDGAVVGDRSMMTISSRRSMNAEELKDHRIMSMRISSIRLPTL